MKFFLDTAEIDEIKEMNEYGLVDGVTTNPSLIKKSGRNVHKILKEISEIIDGPISGEVVATDCSGMINEAHTLISIASNIVIKLPMTMEGIKACNALSNKGILTNVTLCFSPAQAILAAKAGATYVSPFIGRLDDLGQDGMQLINEICDVYRIQNFRTQVLAASLRNPLHVVQAARLGADVATIPPATMKQMIKHPLTDSGLEAFLADWAETGQTI